MKIVYKQKPISIGTAHYLLLPRRYIQDQEINLDEELQVTIEEPPKK